MIIFLLVPAVAILSALLTDVVRRYSLARGVMDEPNARSSHTVPTPRGGGLAIVLTWLLALVVLASAGMLGWRAFWAIGAGTSVVAAVGWLDDNRDLRASLRFATHLGAAILGVLLLGGLPAVDLGIAVVPLGPVGSLFAVLFVAWLVNLYNFMDGIDGIAGVEAVTAGAALAVVFGGAHATGLSLAAATLAAGALGFLLLNWPPARVFMGDVGSGAVGYAFALLALAGRTGTGLPLLLLALPLWTFILDATFTLFRRALRGERLHEAHRSHVYQRLVQAGWSHVGVTTFVAVLNLVLGALTVAAARGRVGWAWAVVGGTLLVVSSGWAALRAAGADRG